MIVKKNILYFISILIFLCFVSYTGSFIISAFFASQEINIILKVILVAMAAIIIGACYIIGSAAQEWELIQDFYAEGKRVRAWEIIAVVCMMVFSICISIVLYGIQVPISSIVSVIFAVLMIPAVYAAGRAAQDLITGALAAVFCMAIPVGAISGQEGFIFENGDGLIASCEKGINSISDGGIFINVLTRLENITNFSSSFPKLIMCIFFFFSIWAGLFLFVSKRNGGVFLTVYFNVIIILQILFDISDYFFLLVYPAAAVTAAMGISFFVHKWIFSGELNDDEEDYDEATESSFEKFSIVDEEDAEEEMKNVNVDLKKHPDKKVTEEPEKKPQSTETEEKMLENEMEELEKQKGPELLESKMKEQKGSIESEESLSRDKPEESEDSIEPEEKQLKEKQKESTEELPESRLEDLEEMKEMGLPLHMEIVGMSEEESENRKEPEKELPEGESENLMKTEEKLPENEIKELEDTQMAETGNMETEIDNAEEEITKIQEEKPVMEEEDMLEEESMLLDQEEEQLFDSREQDEEEAAFFAELASSARETERLKEQVRQAEDELTELTEKYQKQKKQLKDLIQLLEQSKERQKADGQEIIDTKKKVVHLESEIQNLNKDMEEKDALVEEYRERCQEAENVKNQLSESEQRLTKAEEEKNMLQKEVEEHLAEVEKFRKTSEEHRAKAEEYHQAAEESRFLAEQLKEEVASANIEIQNVKAENNRYKEEVESFRKRTEEYRQENTLLLGQIDNLKEQLEISLQNSSKEELERLKTEKEVLEMDYQNRFQELQKEKQELERQYHEEVQKRRELLRRAKEEISKIRSQSQASKKAFN